MSTGRFWGVMGLALASAMLAGCASSNELKARIAGRWGPNPAIQPLEVDAAIKGQVAVLRYIADEAVVPFPPSKNSDWYRIAEWGFNIGRQDCEVYLDNLFRMNREKQRNDTIFTALNTAAAAIITGTTHAQKPLSLVAAAFGLTTAINDALFQSYLFTEAPGLIAIKVKDLQDAYRDTVEKNPSLIGTPEAAYNAIQNYYRLCLPQTIEGTLLQAVSDTTAKTTDPGKDPKSGGGSAKSLNAQVTLEKKPTK